MRDVGSLNPLDSPQIDVLILVPVSATAERDMRIMRQAVEMWEGGIDYLAEQMGLDWLAEGVDFHITIDAIDLTGDDGGEFTTYPIVDPEIVVGANPGIGAGFGLDALSLVKEDGVPCHGIANPFDIEAWEALPGFNSHHDGRSGTYVEDCGGQGGNVCFAVNNSQDPEPTLIDWLDMFFVAAHEVGHCLSLGHVGDGSEATLLGTPWGPVPFDEIMSYANDWRMTAGGEPARGRCVSTLDVEMFATRMSRYLDVNGDGVVGPEDAVEANDQIGVFGDPLQVMHPGDYLYASSTGSAHDCPQPDLGLVPGPRTDWTPDPVPSVEQVLEVTSPAEGSTTSDPTVVVAGSVVERSLLEPPVPSATSVTYEDDPADATSPFTEIAWVKATADESHVEAVLQLGQLWPTPGSAVNYSMIIDDRRFDSYLAADTLRPVVSDGGVIVPGASTEWDNHTGRVTIRIPREFLRRGAVYAPYQVSATANFGVSLVHVVRDDFAPEQGSFIDIAAPPERLPEPVEDPFEDDDLDGVPDESDRCPQQPGLTADGCTAQTPTRIEVSVDGVFAGAQDVFADYGPDDFAIPVELRRGNHTIRVKWLDDDVLLATDEFTVSRQRQRQ